MKRGEKVKDVVEIREFANLYDFAADEGLTLASYRFTDITSDLMGRWIERISDVRPGRGDALALAGFRGVGKSHFLAVLQAIAAHSELRPRIQDPHVAARADLLTKRHLRVANVQRGSGPTLSEELRSALRTSFGTTIDLDGPLTDVLARSSELAGDVPLLIFIDTALGRHSRVKRDDGAFLSEIADIAKSLGIFVGITLDDDISGADGPNSSIARSFRIDFLDQEHLYSIVDRHIFVKDHKVMPILRDIYTEYRKTVPGFNWSERRFVSLYPMHPATLEIAPLIRLFIQDFALLGFASEAGVKIMGRPADSLIGLDEMFGSVELKLRKVPELRTAFDHFDKIEHDVINKAPVRSRLSAKLTLKGLLLLSLDGQGASASSIAASMMISDDGDAKAGTASVAQILDSFAGSFPAAVKKLGVEGPEVRYRLDLGISDGLDHAIAHLLPDLAEPALWESLIRHLSERFPEIQKGEGRSGWSTACTIEWRGSLRRGQIIWLEGEETSPERDHQDWRVRIRYSATEDPRELSNGDSIVWAVAPLTADEKDTVGRYHLLRTNADIWERSSEGSSTTLNILSTAVEKICQRVFFDDGSLYYDGRRYELLIDLSATHDLSHLFTDTFAELLGEMYPSHPEFTRRLGVKEVSTLISDFFGGADPFSVQVQDLARTFAEPLGLSVAGPDGSQPVSKEHLLDLPVVRHVFHSVDGEETILLEDLVPRFLSPPFGMTREAQQLILAALVSQREIEFVTASGNRINHRSLDLHVIWDDVIGVARPAGKVYSPSELLSWVRLLTSEANIRSLTAKSDNDLIRNSLARWESDWRDRKILDDYDQLSDESLNAATWRTAATVHKSLGSVAKFVRSYLDDEIELETCIEAIAELFLGSEIEFRKKTGELDLLRRFTMRARSYREIYEYLAAAEVTDVEVVERSRRDLMNAIQQSPDKSENIDVAWNEFRDRYTEVYSAQHSEFFRSDGRNEAMRELLGSDDWREFEAYSLVSSADMGARINVETQLRAYQQAACDQDPADSLRKTPYCSCGIKLAEIRRLKEIPAKVRAEIAEFNSRSAITLGSGILNAPRSPDNALLRSATVAGLLR